MFHLLVIRDEKPWGQVRNVPLSGADKGRSPATRPHQTIPSHLQRVFFKSPRCIADSVPRLLQRCVRCDETPPTAGAGPLTRPATARSIPTCPSSAPTCAGAVCRDEGALDRVSGGGHCAGAVCGGERAGNRVLVRWGKFFLRRQQGGVL